MKKYRFIINLTILMLMLVLQTTLIPAFGSTLPDAVNSSLTGSAEAPGTVSTSETPTNSANQEQDAGNESLSEQPKRTSPENSRQQSNPATEKVQDLTIIKAEKDTNLEKVILNSLPEITTSKEPDTLSKIIGWWSANPLKRKLWYLFLALSILVFLCGGSSFRKPLLFTGLVIFGFYLSDNINPINSIFSIPIQTGVKLIDSIVLLGIPILFSLFIGRFFCGWVCPIGAVQEFIHPENLNLRLPFLIERIFSYFRFIILIAGIFFSWLIMSNVWNNYDPFRSFFTFKWSLTTIILTFVLLTGSILVERFFCRYLCPLGAILTITSQVSLFKMRPDSNACIACGKCSKPGACSMSTITAVNPYTDLPTIENSECILCYRCANICRYSALKLSFLSKKRAKSIIMEGSKQDLPA